MQTQTPTTPGLTRLEQLKKIMLIIEKLEVYIEGDKRFLLTETAATFADIRLEAQQRIKDRVYLINRLRSYYAKKVFKLASDTYNAAPSRPPKVEAKGDGLFCDNNKL